MYEWEVVISSAEHMPEAIDNTSSQYYIYLRKDIVPYEEFDEDTGQQTFKGWKYLEAKVPNINYFNDIQIEQKKIIEELKAQNEELRQKVEEDNLIIMGGLAETFETLIGEGANG